MIELSLNCNEVIPESVGQFTGAFDKTGKRIFEGDIVKICSGQPDETTLNEIIFDDGEWLACIISGDKDSLYNQLINCEHEVTVIGNVTDNKELLEAKE
jgi:uncharacterized phage protein (TIGR01671 family)